MLLQNFYQWDRMMRESLFFAFIFCFFSLPLRSLPGFIFAVSSRALHPAHVDFKSEKSCIYYLFERMQASYQKPTKIGIFFFIYKQKRFPKLSSKYPWPVTLFLSCRFCSDLLKISWKSFTIFVKFSQKLHEILLKIK